MDVIKRNGKVVKFNGQKIHDAIIKAFVEVHQEIDEEAEACATKIANEIEKLNKTLTVEEIQDLVEKKLMASSHKDVAKMYINYRYLRDMARSQYKELMGAVAEKCLESKCQCR